MTALVAVAASCRALPSHDENGPSAYFDIAAFGDSYTAGNAATDGSDGDGYFFKSPDDPRAETDVRQKSGVIQYVNPLTKDCFRNHNNYSETLYRLLSSSGAYINGACSGDKTDEVLNTNSADGQLNGFTPEQRGEVDLITISIGGNDLGFKEVVEHCFVPVRRSASNCENNFTQAEDKLASGVVYSATETALQRLATEFPNAQIVLVGYPMFYQGPLELSDSSTWVNPTERLREGLEDLNVMQRDLVDLLNHSEPDDRFAFLPLHETDNTGLFDGHGLEGTGTPWIRDFTAAYVEEWAHPNFEGHAAIAEELRNMPFVQDAFNNRIRADYPKMSLTKVGSQWYALDNNGQLWFAPGNFSNCVSAEGFKVTKWKESTQVFSAAVNSSPYPTKALVCGEAWADVGYLVHVTDSPFPDSYILLEESDNPSYPFAGRIVRGNSCISYLVGQGRPVSTATLSGGDPHLSAIGRYEADLAEPECFTLTWP